MNKDATWQAIWNAIKGWDIERAPGEGRAGATGTDVDTIYEAIIATQNKSVN